MLGRLPTLTVTGTGFRMEQAQEISAISGSNLAYHTLIFAYCALGGIEMPHNWVKTLNFVPENHGKPLQKQGL